MSNTLQRRTALVFGIGLEGGLAGLAWGLGWLIGQPPLDRFHGDPRALAVGAAASLPLLLGFVLFLRWPVGPLARIKQVCDGVIRPFLGASALLDLALIAIAAGVGEEMLFRGVIQGALSRWLGPWTGLVIAAALFGLAHPITPTYAVVAGLIGGYLGWLWTASGNLLVPMTTHAVYDVLALVLLLHGPRRSGGTRATGPRSPGFRW